MNVTAPPNIVFLIGFIVFFWIRHVFINHTKGEAKAVSRFDGLEKILIAIMFPGTLVFPLIYLFTPLLGFADYELSGWIRWPGVALMTMSLWLFWRSHADLGRNWSVSLELREGHKLVTEGVYRHIRHPMYAAIWLWSVSQGMILANWLAGWALVPTFAAMYFFRIPREESLMLEKFDHEYRKYMAETGGLFPRIKPGSRR